MQYESKLIEFEAKMPKFGLTEYDLNRISEIRTFSLSNSQVLPEKSRYLFKKCNKILIKHYEHKMKAQTEMLRSEPNRENVKEISRLEYMKTNVEKSMDMNELEKKSHEYAQEFMSASDKLAEILGLEPIQ